MHAWNQKCRFRSRRMGRWLVLVENPPPLWASGLHAVAVQNPLSSLAEDVASTNRLINAQDGPVLLVGHSYGGAVITKRATIPKSPDWCMWRRLLPTRASLPAAWPRDIRRLPSSTSSNRWATAMCW